MKNSSIQVIAYLTSVLLLLAQLIRFFTPYTVDLNYTIGWADNNESCINLLVIIIILGLLFIALRNIMARRKSVFLLIAIISNILVFILYQYQIRQFYF